MKVTREQLRLIQFLATISTRVHGHPYGDLPLEKVFPKGIAQQLLPQVVHSLGMLEKQGILQIYEESGAIAGVRLPRGMKVSI
jgi:hypothetical protein